MKTIQVFNQPIITAKHLNRIAILYIRQSGQIPVETGRRSLHLDQLQLARQYGWPDHLIVLIDEDGGKSGASVEDRTGWQRMWNEIGAGAVGAVFAASISRLTRQIIEFEQLRMLASEHRTLLCIDNLVIDPSGGND